MDVCETATTALENLEQLRIEQPELPTIVHLTAGNAIQMKTTLDRSDVKLQGGGEIAATFQPQVSEEKCSEWPDRIILSREKESAEKCLEVARDVGNIDTQPDQPCGDEEIPDECQSEPLQQQEQRLPIPNLPLDSDKTDDILPLTLVATDDSLSSDDAIADVSQCSNPEWLECQASARRLSSISLTSVSSTATISPSDTLAGASITDESLSSDETAQDLSQNSLESTKYQSDLESVSVSSIVQKAMPCATNEDIEDLSKRRVSFPMKDSDLVTGYLEPANPWDSATAITTNNELINLYKESCLKHNTTPLEYVVLHLKTIDLEKPVRQDRLSLRGIELAPEACEALEEILKRVQYQTIDLTCCSLNDSTASAMFDMIEFYESAVEVDVSDNPSISTAGWQSCNSMIRKSRDLRSVTIRGNPLSETHSSNLGKALNFSNLHTLKLEHCGLTGRPLGSLCNQLRNNKTLRELWLAYNDLYCRDAEKLAELLKANHNIQFLDVSNNNLKDTGVKSIAVALIQQSADLSIAAKILQSQLKLKAIEMKKAAFTETTRNSQQEGNSETETNETTNRSSMNGSRSMLDQLLQLHPGECKEPVQAACVTSNNNVGGDDSGEVKHSCIPNELDSCNQKTLGLKTENSFGSVEVGENIIGDDVQIIISNDVNIDIQRSQTDDEKIAANNNILKDAASDFPLLDSDSTEAPKPYDLNENKGSLNDERLLINTIGDSPGLKTSVSLSPNNSSSPIIFERPSSAEDFERRENQEDTAYTTRSQSSDSLGSDNSFDAMDTHLSAEIKEKITKNDTLGRQQKLNQNNESLTDNNSKPPRGLQALILWNNNLTRSCSEFIADMIGSTNSLEILNIGKNTLSNEFIQKISNNLKCNRTLTTLGLQSSHLNSKGIEKLAEILQFGGNSTLERIDIRDNNVQVEGLVALCDALKSNKSIMQIDIDDEPKRILDDGDGHFHYSKHLQALRSLFAKNQSTYEIPKMRNSRKISLTCQSIHSPVVNISLRNETLDVKKKAGAKLRSPLPSPPTGSPSSSPVPSRFQVSRVSENIKCISSPSHLTSKPVPPIRSSPSPTSRFRVTMVKTDDYLARKEKLPEKVMLTTSTSTDNLGINTSAAENSLNDVQFVFPEVAKSNIVRDNDKSNIIADKIGIPKIIQSEAKVTQQQNLPTANATQEVLVKSPLLSLFEPLPQKPRETARIESPHCTSIDQPSEESDIVGVTSNKALGNDMPSEDLSKCTDGGIAEDPGKVINEKDEVLVALTDDRKVIDQKNQVPVALAAELKVNNEKAQVAVVLAVEPKVEKAGEPVFDQLSELVADNPHANPTVFTDTTPPIDTSDITIFVDVDAEREALSLETKPKLSNESEHRVRKTSWNANAAVEKIRNFLNPANIFHRSNSNESDTKSVSSSESHDSQTQEQSVNPSKTQYLFDVALKELKDFSKAIKQNITPIQSIQQTLPAPPLPQFPSSGYEESPSTIVTTNVTSVSTQQDSCDLTPTHINIEIKENISPHEQQNPPSFSSCAHTDDVVNADKPLKSDTANQSAVDLGDIPKVNLSFAASQGNEIHDS